jgi:hypothetical protein
VQSEIVKILPVPAVNEINLTSRQELAKLTAKVRVQHIEVPSLPREVVSCAGGGSCIR